MYERKLRRLQAKQDTFKVVEKVVFCPKEWDNDSNEDSDSGTESPLRLWAFWGFFFTALNC